MKKSILFLSAITLTACQVNTSTFDYVGDYATVSNMEGGYKQTLSIKPQNNHYFVTFSASEIRGRANCSFSGVAKLKDNQLWLDIRLPEEQKEVLMYIKPIKNNTAVDVFTLNFEERFRMMTYCRGGGSLAGEYIHIQ
ncbi:hypothetical protein [Pasteurella atlantica]|uniref:Uncharacterized protein n=2 Tax=Pasteurellaceae TaxID=712 RepID=A0ACC6HJC0_9PAST|nr:hypothetical protein [Pasteurella atlantica]MDP8050960.1 hypothetical protein [Pasteurella atlantica]MDP8099113.1 hypothetical protein [Pasteurella atlantica]MDP8104229.1 hypothetical protein [Pasteurella atlantica]MDP8107139.1 hypothetical protein [Pasteurella atlantica]MDP8116830.1 hypothetical protein [Pasteurella atlantica]